MMSKLQSWFPNHKSLHLATWKLVRKRLVEIFSTLRSFSFCT
jgi:hypothetical protein